MDEISLETFEIFYNENKSKLYIPKEIIGTKNLNEENIQKWYSNIEKFSPEVESDSQEKVKEPYLFFAKSLMKIFKYIDFNTFLKNVESIANELIIKIKENQKYEFIYFLVPEEISKSNMWVTLLLFHHLNIHPDYKDIFENENFRSKIKFTTNLVNIAKKIANNGTNYKDILCIYCDDMSYTGSQLYSNIYLGKKYNDIFNKINVFIAIPYLTPLVKAKLKTLPYVEYSNYSIVINRYIDELDIQYGKTHPEDVKNVIDIMVNLNNKHKLANLASMSSIGYVAIYFDHKVADELSTFKKILFTGAYPVVNETDCNKNTLISGCENEKIDFKCNSQLYIDYELSCYPSFYKTIKYTINGKNIKTSKSIMLLKSLEYTRGGRSKKNILCHYNIMTRSKKKIGKKWSIKYKKSINCNRPKGFSQKQYCKFGKRRSAT